ncbi:MAG: GNAT family N-acetyltransferase [Alphaproteobacteria bacterium]|jgi:ribosomal protein S18 acetylase RimI-like enzyme|nr:GNAT family N-acetyltransferase [Alphaproteobacteria bacterium]
METKIIPAKREDAQVVVRLMFNALGDYANFLMVSDNKNTTLNRLQQCFTSQETHQLHYSNCLVSVVDNEIVGASTAYAGNKIQNYSEKLSHIITGFKDDPIKIQDVIDNLKIMREAETDEYYMDTLSINKEYQKQGLSCVLIQGICKIALDKGFSKLAIVVQEGKEYLLDYYKKQGFTVAGIKNLGEINYYRLLKNLK